MVALDGVDKASPTAVEAHVLVTLGGASVGDHDLVQKALVAAGMELGFWRIAMRPGKPLMHGRLGGNAGARTAGESDLVHGLLDPVSSARSCVPCTANPMRARIRAAPGRLAVDLPPNGLPTGLYAMFA